MALIVSLRKARGSKAAGFSASLWLIKSGSIEIGSFEPIRMTFLSPNWYAGRKSQLSDDYCIKLMSASPGDRGSPNQRKAAGNKGYNTPNELIRSGHRSRPNLQGDEIPVGGIIQWYVSKESTPEMLAQISRIIAQSGGGTGVGTTSERAFEFVCGVYSPSTGRLVVGGTHMSNSGKGVISLDLYDLNLSKDNMEVSGFSQGNDASHGGADLWKSTISGQVPTMAKHIEGVDFIDLRSRDNEELRAFAKAACSFESVKPTTLQPNSAAAISANPPQPHPISSTCWPGFNPSFSAMRRYLRR